MTPLDRVLSSLPDAKRHGHSWRVACPVPQGEGHTSLSVSEGDDGRVLLHCFGGCETAALVAALGLEMRELFEVDDRRNGDRPHRPSKSEQERQAERILLAVVSNYVVALIEGPAPDMPPDETMSPYCGFIEDLWETYAEYGAHEPVRDHWTAMRPALQMAAPKLLSTIERRLRGEPPPENHSSQEHDGESAADEDPKPPRKSQATLLVELAADAELWHTPDGDAYATISIDGHRENWPLKVKACRRWLARRYYERHHTTPASQAIQDALGVLEGQALFSGKEHAVYTRLTEHDSWIYLDLANERWEAIEINTQGWRLLTEPPVKFRRARGMLPLAVPVPGGSIEDLRALLNIKDNREWTLVKAWLAKALRPSGPFPVLAFHGEQGSAKSTTCRMIRRLIDANAAPLRAEPRDERDLMIAATNGWLISLDNLSHLTPWLSDAICRLATEGGFGTRELYSDAEEVIFSALRPVLLNGIEELASSGDLVDRALIVYLPAISEDARKPEAVLWREFEAKRPLILGALLDAVSAGLQRVDTVKLPRLPRMADFAVWAVAAAPKLGYTGEEFLESYKRNRESAHDLILEASLLTPFLKDIAAKGFTGTATELLQRLNDQATDDMTHQKAWPKNGRVVSNALRRLAPNLRAVGVDVIFAREGKRRTRTITLSLTTLPLPDDEGKLPSAPSAPSATRELPNGSRMLEADDKADAKPLADANGVLADDGRTQADDGRPQTKSPVTIGQIRQSDAADATDAKNPTQSKLCPTCGHCDWDTDVHGRVMCIVCSERE